MTETLFKEVRYTLGVLVGDIAMGRIGLPDIQRPFDWPNAKVRDLFDSMYRGYARLDCSPVRNETQSATVTMHSPLRIAYWLFESPIRNLVID